MDVGKSILKRDVPKMEDINDIIDSTWARLRFLEYSDITAAFPEIPSQHSTHCDHALVVAGTVGLFQLNVYGNIEHHRTPLMWSDHPCPTTASVGLLFFLTLNFLRQMPWGWHRDEKMNLQSKVQAVVHSPPSRSGKVWWTSSFRGRSRKVSVPEWLICTDQTGSLRVVVIVDCRTPFL